MSKLFTIFTLLADWITYGLFNLKAGDHLAESVHFFVEDVTKIFVLVAVLIYLIGFLRASMNIERVRDYLHGRNRFLAYFLAAVFGAITPFCSCSSIPMFLAFTAARIPIGVTMAFLITSPIVNEVAFVLLGSLLGWTFTIIYASIGILAGVIGGIFFDAIKAERFLTPLGLQSRNMPVASSNPEEGPRNWKLRHQFAKAEVTEILQRIWKWIILGIAVGALFHGFVPEEWVQNHLADGQWWSVPLASILGIPLYANATSIVPVAKSMLLKGIPIGTTLTFMMSVVGTSFPEFVLLKQVMQPKLLLILFALLLVLFTLIGWIFNLLSTVLNLSLQ